VRTPVFMLLVWLLISPLPAGADENSPTENMGYPRDAALYRTKDGEWIYLSFPEGTRLYVFDGDSPGKSNCDERCALAWPPLFVSSGSADEVVGNWTVIVRANGKMQWAYEGRPVYRRYHDLLGDPSDIAKTGFHLLVP